MNADEPGQAAVYLSAARYVLGETFHDIGTLAELPEAALAMLREFGLRQYCTTALPPLTLAAQSVRATLGAAGLAPSSIDTVIVATNSFGDRDYYHHRAFARWLTELELAHAYPIGVTFSYCGNVHSAIRLASALLRGGEARHVLLVCTDRVAAGEPRLVPPAISVSSDGAASCLLSTEVSPGAYRVRAVVQASDANLAPEESDGRFVRYLQGIAGGIRKSFELLLARTGVARRDIDTLLPNNYNTWVNGNLVRALDLPRSALFARNIGRIAHVNTADNLINLHDWESEAPPPSSRDLLLLGTGPNSWGLTLLATTDR